MVKRELNLNDIKKLIPHREPMLLVDTVKIIKPFVSALGIKKINNNDHYFKGHFPNKPIMPVCLLLKLLHKQHPF